jgi:hypothetical protein
MTGDEGKHVMQNFIHNVALMASLLALVAGLWQDWEILATVKRMFVSYLLFYFFGSVLYLAIRALPLLESKSQYPETSQTLDRGRDR